MKKVVMTVEDRGIDYNPVIRYLVEEGFEAEWRPLKEQSHNALLQAVEDADAVIAGVEKWDFQVLNKVAPRLKIIARYGIGYDTVDIRGARMLGIDVTNTPRVLAEAVAELALGLYLDLSRSVSKYDAQLQKGKWVTPIMGHNVAEKTVGIVGFGSIGRRFAELLKPFECRILVYDYSLDTESGKKLQVEAVPLDQLILESDCISLHVPVTLETNGMVDKPFLAKMKNTAFLINTGRGALVKEQDLVEALRSGGIAGAALDVYSAEPLPEENILRGVPNLIMTPHIGAATEESFLKAGFLAAECVSDVLNGRRPKYIVN